MAAGRKTGGRAKGTPNKVSTDLKRAILMAAEAAGGAGGMVAYLTQQAADNPGPYLSLLGKILPMQVQGDPDAPLVAVIERRIVKVGD